MNVDGYNVLIERKKLKHINIKVYPDLTIKMTVSPETTEQYIRLVLNKKSDWIRKQLEKYSNQNRISKRKYISGEDHYINGKRYILKVIDSKKPEVKIIDKKNLYMYIRKNSSITNKEKAMNNFYKKVLLKKINRYLPEYEKIIEVKCNSFIIRKLKNKWGSCNYKNKIITFNINLAQKKDSEIKYVIIHELIHLIEKKHNENFYNLMDLYCPNWKKYHKSINELLDDKKKE